MYKVVLSLHAACSFDEMKINLDYGFRTDIYMAVFIRVFVSVAGGYRGCERMNVRVGGGDNNALYIFEHIIYMGRGAQKIRKYEKFIRNRFTKNRIEMKPDRFFPKPVF